MSVEGEEIVVLATLSVSSQWCAGRYRVRMGCDALLPGLGDFEYVLTVVGLLTVIKYLAQLLWTVGSDVRAYHWSRLWQKKLVDEYGKWAGEL